MSETFCGQHGTKFVLMCPDCSKDAKAQLKGTDCGHRLCDLVVFPHDTACEAFKGSECDCPKEKDYCLACLEIQVAVGLEQERCAKAVVDYIESHQKQEDRCNCSKFDGKHFWDCPESIANHLRSLGPPTALAETVREERLAGQTVELPDWNTND